MQKNVSHHKKKFVPTAFKFMLAVGSLAGTVGIWNLLANKDLIQASANNTENAPTPKVEEPLPTVAPLITVSNSPQEISVIQPTSTIRDVTINTTSQNAIPTFSNNSGVNNYNAPAPVTTTQSSKKP
jgi:hypothetical protein